MRTRSEWFLGARGGSLELNQDNLRSTSANMMTGGQIGSYYTRHIATSLNNFLLNDYCNTLNINASADDLVSHNARFNNSNNNNSFNNASCNNSAITTSATAFMSSSSPASTHSMHVHNRINNNMNINNNDNKLLLMFFTILDFIF